MGRAAAFDAEGRGFYPWRPYQSNRLKRHVLAQVHFPVYRSRTPPISRHTLQSPQSASAKPYMSGLRIGSISWWGAPSPTVVRSEEHTSELQSHLNLVCRLLLEKKKNKNILHLYQNLESSTSTGHTKTLPNL